MWPAYAESHDYVDNFDDYNVSILVLLNHLPAVLRMSKGGSCVSVLMFQVSHIPFTTLF